MKPNSVEIGEEDDKPVKVYVQSTIPVVCKDEDHRGKCEILIKVVTPQKLVAAQKSNETEGCMYRITRESWREDESLAYNKSEPLQIMATVRYPIKLAKLKMKYDQHSIT